MALSLRVPITTMLFSLEKTRVERLSMPPAVVRWGALSVTHRAATNGIRSDFWRGSRALPLHLFEAAIDLLSYATYLKCEGKDYKAENLLSLSGVYQPKKEIKESKIPIALTTFLAAHPEVKTIYLHLDRDKTGRLCTETLQELLKKDYEIVDDPPPVGKDFNDFLLSYLGIERPKPARKRRDAR